MPRSIEALVHTQSLVHNLVRARAAAPGAKVWAVIKADAYGHGAERVYSGLQSADGFALLDLAEAERVRRLGWRGPILLLEGCFQARDLELCSRLKLWHVIHRAEQIDWLASHKTGVPHHVYLKMNSGMNRLGFKPHVYRSAWLRLSGLPQVESVTLMTHFFDADGVQGVESQMTVFEAATRDMAGERSLCNSAALLRFASESAAVRGDWVRPGIMLYGSSPDYPAHDISHWDLRPSMSLRAQIIATQDLKAGETLGYGAAFTADASTRVGVVACGYADGYPRHSPSGTPVLVDGQRTQLVGRVAMDMLTVDLTALPGAGVGSTTTLWGYGPNASVLPIDEVANAAGTVSYELMCALAPRVPVKFDE